MSPLRKLAATLRQRGIVISLQRARGMAAEHGLSVDKGGRRGWVLYRRDGLGHPVVYRYLVELVAALAPPK